MFITLGKVDSRTSKPVIGKRKAKIKCKETTVSVPKGLRVP